MTCELPVELTELVWAERLAGIWRASSYHAQAVRVAMLSAYLQGAMDGRHPALSAALTELSRVTAPRSVLDLLTDESR